MSSVAGQFCELPKTTLAWAEFYSSLGFCTIPLWSRTKKAALKWEKFQKEKPALEHLRKWWGRNPNWGIAIVLGKLSGIIVLDPESARAVGEIERRGIPDTWIVMTTRGKHYYFKYPGFRVKPIAAGSAGWPFQDAELRSDAQYVAAPPSIHPSGEQYTWIRSPLDCPLAEAPEWLLELLKPKAKTIEENPNSGPRGRAYQALNPIETVRGLTKGDVEALVTSYVRQARIGNRNEMGFELARRLRDDLMTRAQAREAMLSYQSQVPQAVGKRYTQKEALASLDQAYKVAPKQPGRAQGADFLLWLLEEISKSTDLTGNEKHVLTVLCTRDPAQGKEIFPSYRTLMDEVGRSIGTIARAIHASKDKGWLDIEKIPVATGEKGRYRHKYTIHPPNPSRSFETKVEEPRESLKHSNSQPHADSVSMVSTNRNFSQDFGKSTETGKSDKSTPNSDQANNSVVKLKKASSTNEQRRILPLKEVARQLGASPQTVMSWVYAGLLNCIRIRRNNVRFKPEQIEDFIRRHEESHHPLELPKI